jgi:small subunit ribosomal protein S8
VVPYSNVKKNIADTLCESGYTDSVKVIGSGVEKKIGVSLRYAKDRVPALFKIDRVSKPGKRIYTSIKDLKDYYNGLGTYIMTTPKGVMSHLQAKKLGIGGEIICKVF